ncbi:MAG: S1 RNA-binding domain-containing protein [Peptococcaceae bacterium]|jgi:S1 RNA binding domain protein|nr:S1 RNA-binding domain-containing protein [Peptococcaceae bacterium]
MAIEVGTIAEGIVSGITNFGAFITLPGNVVGLVHISEVADAYVKDVKDYLKEQDKVMVKVINVDPKGKIGLSIKQAKTLAPATSATTAPVAARERPERPAPRSAPRPAAAPGSIGFNPPRSAVPESFEDKLSKFIKESDQKQLEFRRSTDAKRGGRGAGRG